MILLPKWNRVSTIFMCFKECMLYCQSLFFILLHYCFKDTSWWRVSTCIKSLSAQTDNTLLKMNTQTHSKKTKTRFRKINHHGDVGFCTWTLHILCKRAQNHWIYWRTCLKNDFMQSGSWLENQFLHVWRTTNLQDHCSCTVQLRSIEPLRVHT